jgi:hypothetical protein
MCRVSRFLPLVMFAVGAVVFVLGVTHREISATLAGLATMTAIVLIGWSSGRNRDERPPGDRD